MCKHLYKTLEVYKNDKNNHLQCGLGQINNLCGFFICKMSQ